MRLPPPEPIGRSWCRSSTLGDVGCAFHLSSQTDYIVSGPIWSLESPVESMMACPWAEPVGQVHQVPQPQLHIGWFVKTCGECGSMGVIGTPVDSDRTVVLPREESDCVPGPIRALAEPGLGALPSDKEAPEKPAVGATARATAVKQRRSLPGRMRVGPARESPSSRGAC